MRTHQYPTEIKDQAISKSIAGNSFKIHWAVDFHENPVTFLIEAGITHDVKVMPKIS